MSVNILREQILRKLSEIDFRADAHNSDVTPRDSFKKILLNGDGIDYQVIDEHTFIATMADIKYFRALISDYKYYSQRVKRQRIALNSLLEGENIPSAWVLVTCYYLGYYSAIEILRLCGIHNLYFSETDRSEINNLSQTSNRLNSDGVYVSGSVECNMTTGDISIRFKKDGSRPHDVAWASISKIVGNKKDLQHISDLDERNVSLLFKYIVDKTNASWKTPNTLRNQWNYSNIDSYSTTYDSYANTMKYLIATNDYTRVRKWATKKVTNITEDNLCSGLAFVVQTLESTFISVESKIIRC